MAITLLSTTNADRDLTAQVTIYTGTPSATDNLLCQALIQFGDGTKNLDGSGGDFELTMLVGGQTVQPNPQLIAFGSEVRAAIWSQMIAVPANVALTIKVKSPNAADTDVDVTVYLYDCAATGLTAAQVATAILVTPAKKLATGDGGVVTVGTNNDKSGYALTVTPPTTAQIAAAILATAENKLATDVTGRVTVGANADKIGYALTAAYDAAKNAAAPGAEMALTAAALLALRGTDADTHKALSDQLDGLSPVAPVNVEAKTELIVVQEG